MEHTEPRRPGWDWKVKSRCVSHFGSMKEMAFAFGVEQGDHSERTWSNIVREFGSVAALEEFMNETENA